MLAQEVVPPHATLQLPHNDSRVSSNDLRESLNLIVDNGVRSKTDLLATEFTISATDVELLCGLRPGWFERDPAEVVTLKGSTSNGETSLRGAGQVIAFPTPHH